MKFNNLLRRKKKRRKELVTYKPLILVSSMTEVPEGNLGKSIFLVQRGGVNRWVVFECPGGHSRRIEVNLMGDHYPHWNAIIKNKKITLSPSIAVDDKNCDCHFWLEENIAYKGYWNFF